MAGLSASSATPGWQTGNPQIFTLASALQAAAQPKKLDRSPNDEIVRATSVLPRRFDEALQLTADAPRTICRLSSTECARIQVGRRCILRLEHRQCRNHSRRGSRKAHPIHKTRAVTVVVALLLDEHRTIRIRGVAGY